MRKQLSYQIGEQIQNRWEIHKILKGGMGLVYIVYDHDFRNVYAVKTFQDDILAADPTTADRFMQEELAWINLDVHENIARAHFAQEIAGKPYLFLEYVSGGDLSAWIGTPRLTQDLPQVLRFAIQFCDGMTHALSKGIKAHRDIKPSNCLITQDGKLKITDFGLVKLLDDAGTIGSLEADAPTVLASPSALSSPLLTPVPSSASELSSPSRPRLKIGLTRVGSAVGTCTHMAPEQFKNAAQVDWRADIYAFGVLLFEMVAGRLPFAVRATTMREAWEKYRQAHQEQAPPQLGSGCEELDRIVARCLSKRADERGADFAQIRDDLARIHHLLTGEEAPKPISGRELSAVEWNNKAMSLRELGRYTEALFCVERALEINPNLAQAYVNKGLLLDDLGQPDEALTCYERALVINPLLAMGWYNKGNALKDRRQADEALACYQSAMEIDPHLPEVWTNKGNLLRDMGQPDEALTCYARALEINPRLPVPWSNKGALLADKGQFDEALACYNQALEIDPRLAEAWGNKGNLLQRTGQQAEVLFCYDRALEINPRFAEVWTNKGLYLVNTKRFDVALVCFERALAIKPDQAQAWGHKGLLLLGKGQPTEALICYDRALEINPHYAHVWCNKGALLADRGQLEAALDCYEHALKSEPQLAMAWYNKGNALKDMGQLAEALTCYRHALDIEPNYAQAWFNRGVLLGDSGDLRAAVSCFERAYQLGLVQAASAVAMCRRLLEQN